MMMDLCVLGDIDGKELLSRDQGGLGMALLLGHSWKFSLFSHLGIKFE